MLLCHFKFSFKKDKLNFRFIGTLTAIRINNNQTVEKQIRSNFPVFCYKNETYIVNRSIFLNVYPIAV